MKAGRPITKTAAGARSVLITTSAALLLVACGASSQPAAEVSSNAKGSPHTTNSPAASGNGSVNMTFGGAVTDTLTSGSVTCPADVQQAIQLQIYNVVITGNTTSGAPVKIALSQNMFTGAGTYTAAQASFFGGTIGSVAYQSDPNASVGSMTIASDLKSGSVDGLQAVPAANPAGAAVTLTGSYTCGTAST